MAENKFIKRLHGKETAKSVVEIKNTATPTMFTNMPAGDSNVFNTYSDHRGNATGVLQGTDNWKLSGASLVPATTVYGDGRDMTGAFVVGNAGLWIDATYTFTEPKLFTPNTEWGLKLCGNGLLSDSNDTVELTMLIKFGSTMVSKTFFLPEQSFSFSEELVIDFSESVAQTIKVNAGDTMVVQVLCGDSSAHAQIYNGMTVLTALQRRVDAETVASDTKTFDEVADQVDQIQEDVDDLEEYVDDTFVRLDGESIMTGPLKMRATSSFQCAIAPYWDGVGFFKLNSDNSVTLIASIDTPDGFLPWTTNTYNIGSSLKKWKNLYLSGKAFVATINNGGDLGVPANTTGTLATKADVDLAANSGRMITDQGVWYAKMYAATVAPAAENGTNYADFSQVDGQGNPIIVTYNRVNGAWVQDQTITPPAEYDGYVPITSKIWDIAEQAGQQGGKVLWSHNQRTFTPYPQIISFENAALTGIPTAPLPTTDSPNNQVATKEYVDNANPSGTYHPGIFAHEWDDHIRNDVQWLRADTYSWQSGAVYQAAYAHLVLDIDGKTLQSETIAGTTIQFYLADDGHKICPASEESNVSAIYNATGSAWYYIIDTTNQRFKLPRELPITDKIKGNGLALGIGSSTTGYTEMGLRSSASSSDNYLQVSVAASATSIGSVTTDTAYYGDARRSLGIVSNPDKSGIISHRANENGKQYLYFYVGEFTQTAIENTAGITAETLNDKVDKGHQVIAFQAPTAANNYTWYRLYADGWVEQGGTRNYSNAEEIKTITLPITMADSNYTLQLTRKDGSVPDTNTAYQMQQYRSKSTTGFSFMWTTNNRQSAIDWEIKGMAA